MFKERWFNYRPICLVFAFLLLGSVFSFYAKNYTAISIIIAFVILFAVLTISILKKKIKMFLVVFVSFIIGVGAYHLTIYNFNNAQLSKAEVIEARISNVGKMNDSYLYLEADSCIIDNEKISENIIIYVYDSSSLYKNIEIGSKVKFNPSSFYSANLFKYDTPSADLINKNIKYITSVNINKISFNGVDKTFAETVKEKIKNNLELGLTNENVEIAYSSLFGEKQLLNDNQYSAYKLSGVAHLLAVSGLHVGIITAILFKILDIFKVKKWWRFGIVSSFLLFYMYICNFAYSIIRASVMALILMLSKIFGEEYDSLTAISIAGIIIYLINPLCVFDVGFLMSFGCVIGIAMLNRPINKMLIKMHFPKIVADSASISLSTTISLIFIMAYYFQTLNIISIVANIILIPIFTISFVIIFVCSLLSLLLPHVCILLYPVNYILNFINIIATILGNLAISNFNTLQFNYIAIIIYFILTLLIGRMCTSKYQYKVAVSLPIVALLFVCLI